jgi:hypothetical protein
MLIMSFAAIQCFQTLHMANFLSCLFVQALFMPYDHKNTTPDGFSAHQMKFLLEEVNRHHCQERCMIGSGGGSVGLVVLILKTLTVEKHSISLRRIHVHICR